MAGHDRWRLDAADLEVLGLSLGAPLSREVLKKAYRREATRWHPDLNRGREKEATERFINVKSAFEKLEAALDGGWDGMMGGSSPRGPGQGPLRDTGRGSPRSPAKAPTPGQGGSGSSPFSRSAQGANPGRKNAGRFEQSPEGASAAFHRWLDQERRRAAAQSERDKIVYKMRGDLRGALCSFLPSLLLLFVSAALWHYAQGVPSYTVWHQVLHFILMGLLYLSLAAAALASVVVTATRVLSYELSTLMFARQINLFGRGFFRRTVPLGRVLDVRRRRLLFWSLYTVYADLGPGKRDVTSTLVLFFRKEEQLLFESLIMSKALFR